MSKLKEKMMFQKLGGKYQILLDTSKDLQFIPELDEAHWIATSAPLDSFTCDKIFLQYLDTDNNQRIRTDELKVALKWLFSVINDISILDEEDSDLKLSSINIDTDLGKQIKSAAERILKNLKAEKLDTISLSQARSNKEILSKGECNGDGVIPADSLKNPETIKLINDIIATIGSVDDASGSKGINQEILEKFLSEANAYVKWYDKGYLKQDEKSSPVMIRGEETVPVYRSIQEVQSKLDEYFTYCKMLKVDPAIEKRFHKSDDAINALDMNNSEDINNYIKSAPLATPNNDLILHLNSDINPSFKNSLKSFVEKALKGTKKSKELSYSDWESIKKEFANFANWDKGKEGALVELLGIDVIRNYLDGSEIKKLKPLFEKDLAIATEMAQISNVEKLILYKQLLLDFANDFVSLSRLFDPRSRSMIEVGKLVLDGRHFYLNVKVKDIAAHKKIAIKSNICVMYISLTSQNVQKKPTMSIATCVTSGRITNLYTGKKGVFFTPDNVEWDAEIVDFVEMPVSITEALLLPFKKLNKFIKKQTDKFTNSSYQSFEKGVGGSFANMSKAVTTPTPQPQKTSWTGPLMLLGGGIGLAGVGSAFASVTNALKHISLRQVLIFILIVLVIGALPIVIAAFIKLRKRNIGMFLEACGWAMNSPIRLTRKIGLIFTRTPALPPESSKKYFDRSGALLKYINFQEQTISYKIISVVVTVIIAIIIGLLIAKFANIQKVIETYFSIK